MRISLVSTVIGSYDGSTTSEEVPSESTAEAEDVVDEVDDSDS